MKKVELILIRANDIEKYYITSIKFLPKKRSVEFILASSDKDLPELIMFITYINLFPNNGLFMVAETDTKKLGFMVTAVAEQELGEVGKILTKSLYSLLSAEGRANYEKEEHVFKGYESELSVTD